MLCGGAVMLCGGAVMLCGGVMSCGGGVMSCGGVVMLCGGVVCSEADEETDSEEVGDLLANRDITLNSLLPNPNSRQQVCHAPVLPYLLCGCRRRNKNSCKKWQGTAATSCEVAWNKCQCLHVYFVQVHYMNESYSNTIAITCFARTRTGIAL